MTIAIITLIIIAVIIKIAYERYQNHNPLPPIDNWEQYQKDVIDFSSTGAKDFNEHHRIIRKWRREGKYNRQKKDT